MPALPPRPRIFSRSLAGARLGTVLRLDAQQADDGTVRVFYSAQSPDAAFGPPDGAERKRIAGGVVQRFAPGVPVIVALAGRDADQPQPARAEPGLLAGGNVLLGCRSVETPQQVADWLRYHHIHHGATGAVTAPPPFPLTRDDLRALEVDGVVARHVEELPGERWRAELVRGPIRR